MTSFSIINIDPNLFVLHVFISIPYILITTHSKYLASLQHIFEMLIHINDKLHKPNKIIMLIYITSHNYVCTVKLLSNIPKVYFLHTYHIFSMWKGASYHKCFHWRIYKAHGLPYIGEMFSCEYCHLRVNVGQIRVKD